MMRALTVAVGFVTAMSVAPVLAQTSGEQVCRGDAIRLCQSATGDRPRVAACLVQNKDRLSHDCRRFIDSQRN